MQNRTCSASEAGYVNLDGMWRCLRCGCVNNGCDVCRDCGWNRCGCQGGVVWAEAQSSRAACGREAADAVKRAGDCGACPASVNAGHRVQRCPENTRIRRETNCGCAAETAACRNRSSNDCGCAAETAACRNRSSTDCGCARETAVCQTCAGRSDRGCTGTNAADQNHANARVGIVHAEKQALADVYESESALRTGTLFPELHKPMNGRCPACSNCSTGDQQTSFAAWDLRLYLNTHPEDQEALALFRRLCGETGEPNYATTFLQDGCGWNWTDDPWPWECQRCGD